MWFDKDQHGMLRYFYYKQTHIFRGIFISWFNSTLRPIKIGNLGTIRVLMRNCKVKKIKNENIASEDWTHLTRDIFCQK